MRRSHWYLAGLALGLLSLGSLLLSNRPPAVPDKEQVARRPVATATATVNLPAPARQVPALPSEPAATDREVDRIEAALELIDGEYDDPIDLDWERRLSEKPESVVRFFLQETATFGQWARAYRDDLCACSTLECVTALQDDFASRAPPLTDTTQDEVVSEDLQAAIRCASQHHEQPTERAGLSLEEVAALRAARRAR